MMNDQRFKRIIEDINADQISEHINLWPDIQKQIKTSPRRRRIVPRTRTGWLIAALITLLTVGAAAAAVDHLLNLGGDSGLEAVDQQGLITQLGQTKTDGNVTLTLDYAYADSNRITVGYTLSALVSPDDTSLIYPVDELKDDHGHTFIGVAGGGGGGGGGGGSEATPTLVVSTSTYEINYDVFESLGTPASLNLTLSLDVHRSADPNVMHPDSDPKLTTQQFSFTVPFYPGLVMATPQTVTNGGIAMTLQRFAVTPSMTRGVICYDQPPAVIENGTWSPNLEVSAGGKDIPLAPTVWNLSSDSVGNTIPTNCVIEALPQALAPFKGQWTITVPDLYTAALAGDAYQTFFDQRMKQLGIELVPQPDGGNGYSPPDGMTPDQFGALMNRVQQEASIHITGPWVFNFRMG